MRAEELAKSINYYQVHQNKMTALIEHARSFLSSGEHRPQFTAVEIQALASFFTSFDNRVYFIHSLPETITDVLLSMFSRLKNKRGLRGVFVDTFLPHLLANGLSEIQSKFSGKVEAFMKHNRITSLEQFVNHSAQSRRLFEEFKDALKIDSDYVKRFADSPKVKTFLETWLDRYGHNSIARMAKLTLCFENISILAAKSIEWTRPGAGYIELSTRYVNMASGSYYPIAEELSEFGVPVGEPTQSIKLGFSSYFDSQGQNLDGPFPRFLHQNYAGLIGDPKDLEKGIAGETYDVLGNFLPCATLTSVGVAISGEAFPQLLKHLILDATPENLVLAEMVLEEAAKIGGDQFGRHFVPTEWNRATWQYLDTKTFRHRLGLRESGTIVSLIPDFEDVERLLENSFRNQPQFYEAISFVDIIKKLAGIERAEFDRLPNHFEMVSAAFSGVMSFRSWRDLQRQQLATHYRTYVTPELGFYVASKPTPEWLTNRSLGVWQTNLALYQTMKEFNVPPELMQYPLAMGNLVGFQIGANMAELEFCIWQRTKYTVNHEVRQIFLGMEQILRSSYPWWSKISRADMTSAYVFARTDKGIVLF
ncbi:hypothetical protein A2833_00980 [Candidatus Azambacteria bacterium RIFCSPHIGHO2_01_FULL_44_55]|uniref:Uncharacterized protein n=1 Tax=Candidatus Azambacteria bacterium RIFCSPLOWO2_02_FULL_44_14 TaxID=1797306 RepID=A0A1F5CCM6_9BACT|nr:MAG: hypothetical protein A3C78_01740 [Candidatus Azambacteria bacterium RIFCSPHIGHO2_02_FULL_45_18]OGD40131.1 MAG: hypothetical protein A2833_00980 [Candidatus Azambacteria bacterium RIFCSPHIGHO2_01_FULL_44_55]OGD40578.1 MAG: hypothetical protein A3I30_02305 [Candidatus Azambacteria bacterium RIFCSPLOWO2_02_FULL_44_14]OGD49968.1 MAG: hypothetical protein A2608_02075 [Candidatus Azambacteria bacterium RIFOXYD1_FULL_44_10]